MVPAIRNSLIALLAVLVTGGHLTAADPSGLKPTDVVVYKHGYGFVLEEGRVALEDGWCTLDRVPQGSLGTLWLYSPDEALRVDRTIAENRETVKPQPTRTYEELLRANVGERVELRTREGGSHNGVLLAVLPEPAPPAQPDPSALYRGGYGPAQPQSVGVTHLLTQTGAGASVVEANTITTIRFLGAPEQSWDRTVTEKQLAARLVRGDRPATGEAALGMAYMARGLRWIPTYQVTDRGDGRADLRLHATLINDVVDMDSTTVHFAVGVPNFIQEHVLSPLSLELTWQGLSAYFSDVTPGSARSREAFSNAMMTQVAIQPFEGPGGDVLINPLIGAPGTAPDVSGAGADEMFFYRVEDARLARGGRGSFPLIETGIDYEDVYVWDVLEGATNNADANNQRNSADDLAAALQTSKVWHALRMVNTTGSPWTTGPAMALTDGKPVGQDLIRYTPPGATVDLRTSVATSVLNESQEVEVSREPQALQVQGRAYDKVTVEGTLRLANHKTEEIRLSIRRQFEGELLEAEGDAESALVGNRLRAPNLLTRIAWDVPVGAGEALTLKYRYTTYVRHN